MVKMIVKMIVDDGENDSEINIKKWLTFWFE